MQLLNPMALVMSTVHRIVTVAMEEGQVGQPVIGPISILMMYFGLVLAREVQSTLVTAPLLGCEEFPFERRQASVVSQSFAPIRPVSVKRTSPTRDFGMSRDRCFGVPR